VKYLTDHRNITCILLKYLVLVCHVLLLSNDILNISATLLKIFTVCKLYRLTYIYE